ncbi:MAG TPA: sulfur carrier protein ThiS [Bacteroidota bacterium]|nr:sulfur carrier protein ThiS [Bacteroidota bacterium]
MKILLNNKEETLDSPKPVLTIDELLALKKFSFKSLVIRINGELVRRDDRGKATFKEGDRVEVIHLISGG